MQLIFVAEVQHDARSIRGVHAIGYSQLKVLQTQIVNGGSSMRTDEKTGPESSWEGSSTPHSWQFSQRP